ncbi:MAG: membrane lipoprotein lipid attachment site-containing protein [Oscillospiraceae bacterium]|nr:membrane lipoprotein lipid attachment site-containing protein [Oscillospiraceae bacterium]
MKTMNKTITAALAALMLTGCSAFYKVREVPYHSDETSSAAVSAARTAAETEETFDSSGVQGTPALTDETAPVETSPEETSQTGAETAAVSVSEWADAYRSALDGLVSEGDISEDQVYAIPDMCSFIDMTGDGVPEMITSTGDWHMASASVYSYHDGEVSLLYTKAGDETYYDIGVYGQIGWSPSQQMLHVGDMHMGYEMTSIFRIEGGEIKPVMNAYRYNGVDYRVEGAEEYITEFSVNGEKCSEDEYLTAVEKYYAPDVYLLGRDHPLGDALLGIKYGEDAAAVSEKYGDALSFDEVISAMEDGTYVYPYDRVAYIKPDEGMDAEDEQRFTVDGEEFAVCVYDGDAVLRLPGGGETDLPDFSLNGDAELVSKDGGIYLAVLEKNEADAREFVYSFEDGAILDKSVTFEGYYLPSEEFMGYRYADGLIDLRDPKYIFARG